MAVGPVRALLAAHLASVRNRMRREVGRNGAWLFGLVFVGVVATSVGPALVGLAAGGFLLGRALPDRLAADAVGGLASVIAIFGGIVSGTLGGTRQLSWESYRTFPLERRHLLAAEIVAGLGDAVPLLLSLGLVALLGGVAAGRPATAPLGAALVVEGVLFVLLLQLAVGGLATALVRRLRVAAAVVLALSGLGAALPLLIERAGMAAAGRALLALIEALPLGFASLGLADAASGRWGLALARQAYPLGALGALVAIDAWQLGRELERGPGGEEETAAEVRRWSFRDARGGVAELHLRLLLDSPIGRFGLVLPLITVFLVRGPLAELVGRPAWLVPASYAYVALSAMHFQTSFFGLDGHGIKALLTLPLRADDLLAGKVRALAVYQATQAGLLTLLLAIFHRPDADRLAAGALLSAAAFCLQATLGQFTSSWMPRPIARKAVQKSGVPLPLLLVSTASFGLVSGALTGAYALLAAHAPGWLVPAMASIVAASAAALRLTLAPAARYFDASRERVAERIGG